MEAAIIDRPTATRRLPWGVIAVLVGVAALVVMFAAGMLLIPRYRAAHPSSPLQRSDADRTPIDDLYLDVTLATPRFLETRNFEQFLGGRSLAGVLPLLVGINTHTGNIEHMHHFHGQVELVGPDGARYPALTEPIVLSQHHNAYMLLFPARDNHGVPFLGMTEGTLRVEASDVGSTPLRTFEWTLPIDESQTGAAGIVPTMMLALALASALMVVLSPCALELTLYYSAIISCTVADGEAAARAKGGSDRVGQRRVMANLMGFVAGFTLLYAASGATVGLIGEGVRSPLGRYGGVTQVVGGGLILFFALKVLGLFEWLGKKVALMRGTSPTGGHGRGRIAQLISSFRLRGQARARQRGRMTPSDSFLVGIGLSSACLTCMGGAVLYPLLVYAGITSWYAGMVTLGLYSLAIALPMLLIGLGFVKIRLTLKDRVGITRSLRAASGVLLLLVGALLITGNERIMTDLAFGFLAKVATWVA